MENGIKYHKTFGQVQIISSDVDTTTIIVTATGEEKRLLNKYVNLTDAPVEVVKVKRAPKYIVSEATKALNLDGSRIQEMFDRSTANYRAGRYGASKFY